MPEQKVDNRRDVLLLLLYSPGKKGEFNEPITGRTRLVKMLFLFREEGLKHFRRGTKIDEHDFYEFFPWNFGPFSRQVYDDLTFFTLRGFIEAQETTEDPLPQSAAEWEEWLTSSGMDPEDYLRLDYSEEAFRLTERGRRFTESLYATLSDNQRRFLREFKRRLTGAAVRAIVRYVYENYPEYTTRSEIKEQVLDAQ